jgi:hypothetical protein
VGSPDRWRQARAQMLVTHVLREVQPPRARLRDGAQLDARARMLELVRETAQALLGRLALEACAFRTRLSCMPRRASPSRHRYRRRVRHGRQQLRQQARSARSAATRPRRRSVRAQIGPNRPTNRLRTPSPSSNGVVETGGLPSSLALGASGLAIEVIFTRTSPCLSRKPLLYIFD